MKVEIQLKETSQPLVHIAFNTYEKGSLYCVFVRGENAEKVYKYPIENIFRVVEDYSYKKEGEE